MSTDKDWEKWGAIDPYFGVLSIEQFRKDNLDESTRREFFATGNDHVERVFGLIEATFKRNFSPESALDFGCGVGRLALPLASRTRRTVGLDISPSMLAEASRNAQAAGLTNVTFALSDDALANATGPFSLVHSYIVLQHIPWTRGRKILQSLAEKVEPDGYLAIQLLTSSTAPALVRAAVRLRYALPPLNWLRNAIKGRPLSEPVMQLHCYDLNSILSDLAARHFEIPALYDEPSMEGFHSIFLFARRASNAA